MIAKKTPEERGYIPVENAAKELRQLADDIEALNKGRLAKISLNVWYADVENKEDARPAVGVSDQG